MASEALAGALQITAILFWVGLGATVVLVIWLICEIRREVNLEYSPYAEWLGKPCWLNICGDYAKHRIVAVSHKGAISVREWDDYSGKHAFWIKKQDVPELVKFGESPEGESK